MLIWSDGEFIDINRYPKLIIELLRKENRVQVYILQKLTDEEILKRHEKKLKELNDELTVSKGFTRCIDAIAAMKKPLIVHNGLLDLLHMHEKFKGTLPTQWDLFKQNMNEWFPTVLDTKYIFCQHPTLKAKFEGLSLSELAKHKSLKLDTHVDMLSESMTHYAQGTDAFHEAGYDAYCTGRILVEAFTLLATHQTEDKDHDNSSENIASIMHETFAHYQNKLNCINLDIPFYNLDGLEEAPDRPNAYHIQFTEPLESDIDIAVRDVFWKEEKGKYSLGLSLPRRSITLNILSPTSSLVIFRDEAIQDIVRNALVEEEKEKKHIFAFVLQTYSQWRADKYSPRDFNGQVISSLDIVKDRQKEFSAKRKSSTLNVDQTFESNDSNELNQAVSSASGNTHEWFTSSTIIEQIVQPQSKKKK